VADSQRQYLSSVSFTNQGLLSSMNLGNGTSESFGYNDRFQMTSQNLNKGSQVLQKYDYGYGQIDASGNLDLTKNNGQLGRIESFIGTQKQSTQKFSYDSIGRLSQAKEYKGTDNLLTYKQHFDFDRFGNMYRKAANNGTAGQANPLPMTAIENSDISKSTNRFTTNTTYNDAGMVISDTKFRSMNFSYDANGRQVNATNAINAQNAQTVYDALGNRVATKMNDSWQFVIYDAFGKLVAEYGTQGEGNGGVSYVLQDWQGSVRASVNANGFIQARFDFTAFGEEINLNVGLRSIEQGYSGDATTRQGYGLTEKDSSGLNHTWFRKNENRVGRWTSPDPYKGSMNLGNPQSFNRYSYVQNEPIGFVDPSGLLLIFCRKTLVIRDSGPDTLPYGEIVTECWTLGGSGGGGGGGIGISGGGGGGGSSESDCFDKIWGKYNIGVVDNEKWAAYLLDKKQTIERYKFNTKQGQDSANNTTENVVVAFAAGFVIARVAEGAAFGSAAGPVGIALGAFVGVGLMVKDEYFAGKQRREAFAFDIKQLVERNPEAATYSAVVAAINHEVSVTCTKN
jgi:RHS repeat-associated protein